MRNLDVLARRLENAKNAHAWATVNLANKATELQAAREEFEKAVRGVLDSPASVDGAAYSE